jgi:hypothetical protein
MSGPLGTPYHPGTPRSRVAVSFAEPEPGVPKGARHAGSPAMATELSETHF